MSRQFFVGGNFKMNPATREAKRALVKILNEATLNPQTGEHNSPQPHLLGLIVMIR
jgi:triosephosphate isomerase